MHPAAAAASASSTACCCSTSTFRALPQPLARGRGGVRSFRGRPARAFADQVRAPSTWQLAGQETIRVPAGGQRRPRLGMAWHAARHARACLLPSALGGSAPLCARLAAAARVCRIRHSKPHLLGHTACHAPAGVPAAAAAAAAPAAAASSGARAGHRALRGALMGSRQEPPHGAWPPSLLVLTASSISSGVACHSLLPPSLCPGLPVSAV
jgi:hypothetical protein